MEISENILKMIDGQERQKYAKKHGISSLINMYHGLHWNDAESERVYKICNDKGITWQEYYKIPKKQLFY